MVNTEVTLSICNVIQHSPLTTENVVGACTPSIADDNQRIAIRQKMKMTSVLLTSIQTASVSQTNYKTNI